MELYNWQLLNIPVWEAAAFKYCIRASVTPARGHFLRSRCYFRTVKFYNHRGFPGKAAGGGGIPVTSWCLQTGSKVGDFFFWVWRLNNKQHWFVAATCWARTNVKGDHNEIYRNTCSTIHQLQMACFHSKWCQFHQGKRVSSSGSGDLVDTSEGSATLKSTHLCCSWQLSQVLVRLLLWAILSIPT